MSVKDLVRGSVYTGQQPPPRASLVDDEDDEETLGVDALPALLATRPKSRAECCPTPDTVICPVDTCRAAVGRQCEGRAPGAFHQERKELARAHLRPCPWVSCPHHKYLTVAPNGSIIFNYPDHKPWELERSCELDDIEATNGSITLEELGEDFSLTRERMRQIEAKALAQLAENEDVMELAADLRERPTKDGIEEIERRLNVEALAKRTVFSSRPPLKLGVVGKCPKCQVTRYREDGRWRCGCRRRSANDE